MIFCAVSLFVVYLLTQIIECNYWKRCNSCANSLGFVPSLHHWLFANKFESVQVINWSSALPPAGHLLTCDVWNWWTASTLASICHISWGHKRVFIGGGRLSAFWISEWWRVDKLRIIFSALIPIRLLSRLHPSPWPFHTLTTFFRLSFEWLFFLDFFYRTHEAPVTSTAKEQLWMISALFTLFCLNRMPAEKVLLFFFFFLLAHRWMDGGWWWQQSCKNK